VSGVVLPEADVIEELWQNALAVKARDKVCYFQFEK